MFLSSENTYTVKKGDWVRAEWFEPYMACLAGAGTKTAAKGRSVSGIVRHVRGDHPTNPTSIRLFVEPDTGGEEVLVDPSWVKEVRTTSGVYMQNVTRRA